MRNSLMRVAQLVLPGASAYERKSQRLDNGNLPDATLITSPAEAAGYDVAHVYGPIELPPALFVGFPVPYVSNGTMKKRRFALRAPRMPAAHVVTLAPLGSERVNAKRPDEGTPRETTSPSAPDPRPSPRATGRVVLPEAVDDAFFDLQQTQKSRDVRIVGSVAREPLHDLVERTIARIHRFRDDIDWHLFSHDPSPAEMADVDAWIDPAIAAEDYDGYVAEALVLGLPVVASRTPINVQRCEHGRTGLLVPVNDPNELVHAILAALFKSEVVEPKKTAARQTASKFRKRQRLRVLAQLYDNVTS
jgi:hypothetical protein